VSVVTQAVSSTQSGSVGTTTSGGAETTTSSSPGSAQEGGTGASASAAGGASASSETAGSGSSRARSLQAAAAAAALAFTPAGRPVSKLRATRAWVRSGSRSSATKIVFRLHRRGLMRFVLTQIAPRCRRVGTFSVRAHAGLNSFVLRGRLHGRPLPVGTYVLSATVGGRPVLGVTIVVTASRPTAAELARARARNVCGPGISFRGTTIFRQPLGVYGPVAARVEKGSDPPPSETAVAVPRRGDVLGAQFSKSARRFDLARMFLLAAAAAAIVLLGLAALPASALADPRLAAVVEHRRVELALAGAGTLLGAVVAYLAGAG
jgi:hypothetical protein